LESPRAISLLYGLPNTDRSYLGGDVRPHDDDDAKSSPSRHIQGRTRSAEEWQQQEGPLRSPCEKCRPSELRLLLGVWGAMRQPQ